MAAFDQLLQKYRSFKFVATLHLPFKIDETSLLCLENETKKKL